MTLLDIIRYATASALLALGIGAVHAAPTVSAPAGSGGAGIESAIAEVLTS
jgi:hypothetical protein